jgi:hypothetical protein
VSLRDNLTKPLEMKGIEARVSYSRIDDHTAESMGLSGSPAVLINGVDPFPSEIGGFSWRIYEEQPGRFVRVPSV